MMKDINLTWKADGIIDSYTIYRAEDESLDINTLPPSFNCRGNSKRIY